MLLAQCFKQLILALEINIDRALGNACFTRDVIHAGSIKTHAQKYILRTVQNFLTLDRILSGTMATILRLFDVCHACFAFLTLPVVYLPRKVNIYQFEPISTISIDMPSLLLYVNIEPNGFEGNISHFS